MIPGAAGAPHPLGGVPALLVHRAGFFLEIGFGLKKLNECSSKHRGEKSDWCSTKAPVERGPIEILEGNGERYDLTIVAALRTIVQSPAGDRLMQDLQREELGLS